jgi:hypothetical protein
VMSNFSSLVALFDSYARGENAIRELQAFSFDMQFTIIGEDHHVEKHFSDYYRSVSKPLVTVSGLLVDYIVGALEEDSPRGGLSALGGGLLSIGIPRSSVVQYESDVKNGKCLVILHGTTGEVEQARVHLGITLATTSTVYAEQADTVARHEVRC